MAAVLTPAVQRQALADLLATIDGIGVVHQRRRVIREENDIRRLLVPQEDSLGRVNAWMIYPSPATTTVTERKPGHHGHGIKGGGNVFTTFQWQIDAYYYIDDAAATETTFTDLAWAVADEINAYGSLPLNGSPMPGLVEQLPADVEQFGYIMLAGIKLCHYARIGVAFNGRTRPT